MQHLLQIILLMTFSFSGTSLQSQQKCVVLKPEIAGSYTGKCRNNLASGFGKATGRDSYEGGFIKGLPDGYGTYTWSTGEVYKGSWKRGKRNGTGELRFSADSIISGIWIEDKYAGEKIKKPVVIYKTGIDRYTIQKNGSIKNRVLIDIYQNGIRNSQITNLLTSSSSGFETTVGQSFGYDEVTFPVNIKVTYTTPNKLKTVSVQVVFQFEISEPGDWMVKLHN